MQEIQESKENEEKCVSKQFENEEQIFDQFILQLRRKADNNKRKVWSQEQDKTLLELTKTSLTWEQIGDNFDGVNSSTCYRRYERLMKEQALWSKKIDEEIVRLRQVEGLDWPQIRKILQESHSASEIRQRYQNQLRKGILQSKWSIEQDLNLLKLVNQHSNKWAKISQQLQGRSERQVKNRYCRTLKPILIKMEKNLNIGSKIIQEKLSLFKQ